MMIYVYGGENIFFYSKYRSWWEFEVFDYIVCVVYIDCGLYKEGYLQMFKWVSFWLHGFYG